MLLESVNIRQKVLSCVAAAYFVLFVAIFSMAQEENSPISPAATADSGLVMILPVAFQAGSVVISSTPDSAQILLAGKPTGLTTPATFDTLSPGSYIVELIREDFEPLATKLELSADKQLFASFVLKAFPPPPATAESMNLEYMPERPMRDVKAAKRIQKTFNQLTETFLIIPFGQGLLAKLVAGEANQKSANVLVIVGAALSGGSYLAGKILSSRKRRQIENDNTVILKDNEEVDQYNSQIDLMVKSKNQELVGVWLSENRLKGKIILDSILSVENHQP